MQNDILASLTSLSDAELVAQVKSLVARDRDTEAQLVARLAELDTRDVHLRERYGSLFVYCRDALGLSEWEAYNRIEVARAARRFPFILDLLTDGSVNLTGVRLLAPHLTAANQRTVLESSRGKTTREIQEIVATLAPRPDVPSSVRRHPAPRPASPIATVPVARPLAEPCSIPALAPDTVIHVLPARPAVVEPLSPDRYKLQLTIGGGTLEKLRLARTARSRRSSSISRRRSSPTRQSPALRGERSRVRAIRPPRCSAPSGCVTSGVAPSFREAPIQAARTCCATSSLECHALKPMSGTRTQ